MIFGVIRMTAKVRRLLSYVLVVAAGLCAVPTAAQSGPVFRHGVALFLPLMAAKLQPGSTQFVFPPFTGDVRYRLTTGQLAAIHNAGFDFVRLPVDPGPFLQFKGSQRDGLDDILRQRLQMILDAGLAVIVDFHPSTSKDYGDNALVQGIDTPLFNAYCDMLTRTARLLDGFHTNRVALELMNEPPPGGTPDTAAVWQAMEQKLYHAARAGAPNLFLVLQGGYRGYFKGLPALDPTPFLADKATFYTFHYYEPMFFTHQSYPASDVERLAADVPYPANARAMSESIAALSARLDAKHETAVQKLADMTSGVKYLTKFHLSNFDRSAIEADFGTINAWARTYGIPPSHIFLGEFGVIRRHQFGYYGNYDGARDAERLRWLRDVRQVAEADGFFWSVWAYDGWGGMAIVNNEALTEIDPGTLVALGLH